MSENRPAGWDFFVSYTQADRNWAEWIAWVLEEDGRKVLVQAWDFVAGGMPVRPGAVPFMAGGGPRVGVRGGFLHVRAAGRDRAAG